MKIVCISDTHTKEKYMIHEIPDGDVLIHAGDFMNSGWNMSEYGAFLKWFSSFPHKHKILIAGNHDRFTEINESLFKSDVKSFGNIIYLRDEEIIIEGIKFYGTPWQPWFHFWSWNFSKNEVSYEKEALYRWGNIPLDTNVLICHGQPYGINDKTEDGTYTGCKYLKDRIFRDLKQLKLFVAGHIHYAHGITKVKEITFINASICDEDYRPVNAPIIFNLE